MYITHYCIDSYGSTKINLQIVVAVCIKKVMRTVAISLAALLFYIFESVHVKRTRILSTFCYLSLRKGG